MKRHARPALLALLALTLAACGPIAVGPGGGCQALTSNDVSGGVTLAKGCYTAADNLEVTGGTLTLKPGVTLTVANGKELRIDSDAHLKAVGTAADPIVLQGKDNTPGYWMGVGFFDSKSTDNDLEYVTIKNGGADGWTGAGNSAAGLAIYGNSLVKMDHGTITGSPAAGFIASGELDLTNTKVTGNKFPGWAVPVNVGHIDPSNQLTGNTHDELRVDDDNAMGLDSTWHKLDVPYLVAAWIEVGANSTFTLDAGVTVKMANQQYLAVDAGCHFIVNGTAADPVTITGADGVPGDWQGISLQSAGNEIHNATISDAGSEPNLDHAEILLSAAILTMDHVTVSDSSGWAISLRSGSNLSGCPTVTFTNDAQGNVEGDAATLSDCP